MADSHDRRVADAEKATQFRPDSRGRDWATRWVRDGPELCLQIFALEADIGAGNTGLRQSIHALDRRMREQIDRVRGLATRVGREWPPLAERVRLGLEAGVSGSVEPADRAVVTLASRAIDAGETVKSLQQQLEAARAGSSAEEARLIVEIPEHEEDLKRREQRIGQLQRRLDGLADDLNRAEANIYPLQDRVRRAWAEAVTLLRRREGHMTPEALMLTYVSMRAAVGLEDPYFEAMLAEQERLEARRLEAAEQRELQRWLEDQARDDEFRGAQRARSVTDMGLSAATQSALLAQGIRTAGELDKLSSEQLESLGRIGPARIAEIQRALSQLDLEGY